MAEYDELVKMLRTCAERDSCIGWREACPHLGTGVCDNKAEKAADAIEELLQKTQQLPRWIPVAERLPEPYTWVLVSAEKHEVAFDAFYDGAQWKDAVLNGLIVTHWMPLPEPPKGVE